MIGISDFPDVTNNIMVEWDQLPSEFTLVRDQLAVTKGGDMQRVTDHSKFSSVQTARRRADGGNAYQSTIQQGYRVTFTKQEIAMELDITKQMRMYDRYDEIMDRTRALRNGVQRRMEMDLASLLYNAWATSYTNIDGETVNTVGPDGLALMQSAHTANGSSNTYNNQVSDVGGTHDAFSVDVLERLEEAGNSLLDEADGRNIPTEFDTIITGRHAPTVQTVSRVLNSMYTPGSSSDSDHMSENTFKGAYKHLVVPFLDLNPADETRDRTRYRYTFLANLGNSDRNGFYMPFSQEAQLDPPFEVTESGVWQYVATADYDFGLKASNFIVGTKGDGSTVA